MPNQSHEARPADSGTHTSQVDRGPLPIVYVDLDNTLLHTDLLFECIADLTRRRPWKLFLLPFWLAGGKASLKAKLADFTELDVTTLPYDTHLVDYLIRCKEKGHEIVLATAANERLARAISDHVGIFVDILASTNKRNLKGAEKTAAIETHSAGADYWYAGDDVSDLAIWVKAEAAVLINSSPALAKRVHASCRVEHQIPRTTPRISDYFRAARIHQWAKNLLLFVALLAAHRWSDATAITAAALGFVAFSLSASGVYLLNDLIDLPFDRRHPTKRARPLASGTVPIKHALVLVPILTALGIATGLVLGPVFVSILVIYLFLTLAYSLHLKSYVLIDVGTLASLYTIRVVAGAAAIGVVTSFWLLAFSVFLFLSLALIKRCSELITLSELKQSHAGGRDYAVGDLAVLEMIGVASGFAAVLVLALFINSESGVAAYSRPEVMWLLCGTVLYWIARMWLKTARGEMHEDPLLYAFHDRGSIVMALVSALLVIIAI